MRYVPEHGEGRDRPDPVNGEEEESGCGFTDKMDVEVGRHGCGRCQLKFGQVLVNQVAFNLKSLFFTLVSLNAVLGGTGVGSHGPGNGVHGAGDEGLFSGRDDGRGIDASSRGRSGRGRGQVSCGHVAAGQ